MFHIQFLKQAGSGTVDANRTCIRGMQGQLIEGLDKDCKSLHILDYEI